MMLYISSYYLYHIVLHCMIQYKLLSFKKGKKMWKIPTINFTESYLPYKRVIVPKSCIL